MRWRVVLGLSLGLTVYLVLGGVAFHLLESGHEAEIRQLTGEYMNQFLENKTCLDGADLDLLVRYVIVVYDSGVLPTNETSPPVWDFFSSLFFSATVITTIGYGNISPTTQGGRVFFVFYALFGIPLCLILLAGWGDKLTKAAENLDKKLNGNRCPEKPVIGKTCRACFILIFGFTLFCFIPAVAFSEIEGWTYGDALYYVFVTLTTIGFGDYVPALSVDGKARWVYSLGIGVWILLGLAWLATIVSFVQDLYETSIKKATNKTEQAQDETNEDLTCSIHSIQSANSSPKADDSSKNGLRNSTQNLDRII